MSNTTTQTCTESPMTLPQPQPIQGSSTTQFILAIAILTKSLALLIAALKK